jgi:hypothetical protein
MKMNTNSPLTAVSTSFSLHVSSIEGILRNEEEIYGEENSSRIVFLEEGQFGVAIFENSQRANELGDLFICINRRIEEKKDEEYNGVGGASCTSYQIPSVFFKEKGAEVIYPL